MAHWTSSLRIKAMLGLLIASLVALIPATLFGWRVVSDIQDHFGRAYARNLAELSRQQILSPVLQDLVLARRLADSTLLVDWFSDIESAAKRQRFFAEAQRYARDFSGGAYFAISAETYSYYFNEAERDFSDQPRYGLDPDKSENAWFFSLIQSIDDHNINVNPDVHLKTTRVWMNVAVRGAEQQLLGLAGTGLDLTQFIQDFIASKEAGVTPMLVDSQGAIQAHPDPGRIAYGSGAGLHNAQANFALQSIAPEHRAQWHSLLQQSQHEPDSVALARLEVQDYPHLVAVAYLAELDWYLVTLIDLGVANVIGGDWWVSLFAGLLVVLAVLLLAITLAVDRLLIRPLKALRGSATQIAQGDYQIQLNTQSSDEIGELSRAFAVMVDRVQSHTQELEAKVRARTQALEDSHQELAAVNKLVTDSIDYALLIQRAILPDLQMQRELPELHFVLWQPKDVVGGDFYFFQSDGDGYLFGIVDCAGHGVPGALMTMLARAALDNAIRRCGIDSPARILLETDQLLRAMLQDLDLPRALATNMDAGLVRIDKAMTSYRFAGAKLSLYLSQQAGVTELKGNRRALVGRKPGDFTDSEGSLNDGEALYLTSDGFLDQSGGEFGFGMGSSGFIAALSDLEGASITTQGTRLMGVLDAYRGANAQRDDICVLGIKILA